MTFTKVFLLTPNCKGPVFYFSNYDFFGVVFCFIQALVIESKSTSKNRLYEPTVCFSALFFMK